MNRKRLLIIHVLFFISFLLAFVFGPYYSNYSVDHFEDWEPDVTFPQRSLNFSAQQEHELLAPTFLDWNSIVIVNFNSTNPIYVLVIEDSLLPLYERSIFDVGNQTLVYHVPVPSNYTVWAKGFDGTANITVILLPSIVTRDKPYASWGQVMSIGGIGLLTFCVAYVVMSWVRQKRQPPPKQPSKEISVKKKTETKR
ncbi:MAG: hypothetical protein ACQXXH_00545 [Candidatus Bathyarchaeia archaeon]|nr:hypothetical protein [Candidatus Bathyarchaeota archaeon A05DMB-4]MDH7595445.1 hypothetical protein [Candidatus Bathyarchaeota archaeon]